jgi:hypothetical protein
MEDVYDKNGNCDIIKEHILLDRLTLTFGQAIVRNAVVIDRANHIYIGDSIWPQYSKPDISDEKLFNSFFESITPIYFRYFGFAEKDTALISMEFSDKKTLELELSCDEIGNTDRRK